MKNIIYLILILTLLASCAESPLPQKGQTEAKSSMPRNTSPLVDEYNLHTLVEGNTVFGINLYQVLRNQQENIIISPYSITLALAMTQAGAKNETLTQMNDALHFSLPAKELHPTLNALQLALNAREDNAYEEGKKDFELNITNAIWGEKTYTFLPEYLDILAENYGAGLRLADFINEPDASRKTINQWVSEETNNKINDLLADGTITPMTRLVLTNAIYFKASWLSQFDDNRTHAADFVLLDGSTIQVPTMQQTDNYGYLKESNYQIVSLPYEGNKLSMLIVLPDEGKFPQVEESLSSMEIQSVLGSLEYNQIDLSLPKFKIESSFGLTDALAVLGLQNAFNPEAADFSGMDGTRELFISAVKHKAFIEVDEEGTEAAAATAVVVGITSMPLEPIQVKIDHPFIFFIIDNESGTVLFMGRVVHP